MNVNYNQQTFSIYDQIKPMLIGSAVFLFLCFFSVLPLGVLSVKMNLFYASEESKNFFVNIDNICTLLRWLLMVVAGIFFAAFSAKKFPVHMNYLRTEKCSIWGQIFICVVIVIMFCYGEMGNGGIFDFLHIYSDLENPSFVSYALPITFETVFSWSFMAVHGLIMYIPYVLAMRLCYMKR